MNVRSEIENYWWALRFNGARGLYRYSTDRLARWIAWILPRQVALWAFVRVYASGCESPGPEYTRAHTAWQKASGR